MALVTTTLTPPPSIFSYSGMSDVVGVMTDVPRAEVHFTLDSGDVTLSGVGDTQRLIINCVTPQGYAYVMREVHFAMFADDIDDWGAIAWLGFQDGESAGTRSFRSPMEMFSDGTMVRGGGLTAARIWTPKAIVKQVVIPNDPKEGCLLEVFVNNNVTNGDAAIAFFSARLLQFDIEQANNFAVNNPSPVR